MTSRVKFEQGHLSLLLSVASVGAQILVFDWVNKGFSWSIAASLT